VSDVTLPGYFPKKAQDYNLKYAKFVGFYNSIPPKAIDDYPDLDLYHEDIEAFSDAVCTYQEGYNVYYEDDVDVTPLTTDGKLGPTTWLTLVKWYNYVEQGEQFIIHNGIRIVMPRATEGKYKLITWEDEGGYSLYHGGARFYKDPGREIAHLLFHWGCSSTASTKRALDSVGFSTHFSVEQVDGIPHVFQYLDSGNVVAYHAGEFNPSSIGIDISRLPLLENKALYESKGDKVEVISNLAYDSKLGKRGNGKVLSLDPTIVQCCIDFKDDMCEVLGLDNDCLRQDNGEIFHGIIHKDSDEWTMTKKCISHHQVKRTKWDVGCWMDKLFPKKVL
jgi:hypothetical protein